MKRFSKILFLVVVMISAFTIVGCGKKEEKKKVPEIVGTWEYNSGSYTYTFNEDGTGTYDIGGQKKEFTYKTDGDKLSITYNGSTASFDTTYSIKDNELNIKDSFGSDTIYKRK